MWSECNMAAKMTARINWLGAQCERGHEAAYQKLRQELSPDYRGPADLGFTFSHNWLPDTRG